MVTLEGRSLCAGWELSGHPWFSWLYSCRLRGLFLLILYIRCFLVPIISLTKPQNYWAFPKIHFSFSFLHTYMKLPLKKKERERERETCWHTFMYLTMRTYLIFWVACGILLQCAWLWLDISLATCCGCIPAAHWVSWTEVIYTSYRCKTFWGILSQGKMKKKLGTVLSPRPQTIASILENIQPHPHLALHQSSLPHPVWPWLFFP